MTIRTGLLLLAVVPLLAACSTLDTKFQPKTDLSGYRHVFVEHLLSDGNGTDQLIARELKAMGFDSSSGPMTMMPEDTEIIVSYEDRWTFDFANYMIELDMKVRKAGSDKVIATGHFRRPSITGGSTLEMVDTLLNKLFKAKPAPR